MPSPVIRKTKSVCPNCFSDVDAQVVERQGAVFLDKACPVHGDFSLLLSRHPGYYRDLEDFYFSLMSRSFPQKDYIVHLTNRCELNCPICLARANNRQVPDYPLELLKEFLKGKKGYKIDLMGAEPTCRNDLDEIIRMVSASGNIAALHTNGIRIADYAYLKQLKEAGLDEVHLQFDGFDDAAYEKLRGKKLLAVKKEALKNLEELDISTDLVATIQRGVNEHQISPILNYGASHSFVKEVFFLGCRYLGNAKTQALERCFMPDEVIDLLEEQTGGVIARKNIRDFQKLYYCLLSAFSVRKCFYIQHYMVCRTKGGYVPVDRVFNLGRIRPQLERFRKMRVSQNRLAVPYLLFSLGTNLIGPGGFFWAKEFFSYFMRFTGGFNLGKLPRKSVLIGFISACDAYSLDYAIASNCGKGALSVDLGLSENGAVDNVLRDREKASV